MNGINSKVTFLFIKHIQSFKSESFSKSKRANFVAETFEAFPCSISLSELLFDFASNPWLIFRSYEDITGRDKIMA